MTLNELKIQTTLVNDCWIWNGVKNYSSGRAWPYGLVTHDGKRWRAHRLAYFLSGKTWYEHMQVNHICNNTLCINPDHLYLGDASDNQHDSVRAGTHHETRKTHCPKGHIYDHIDPRGNRRCKTCDRERKRGTIP